MALAASGSYAEQLVDDVVADLAAEHGDDFDEAAARENLEPLADRLEEMVRSMLSDADVDFSAGQITGTDSNGDTHSNLTASGGSIS